MGIFDNLNQSPKSESEDPANDYQRSAEQCSLHDLKPHPRNYRQHSEDQIEHIKQSIKDHGFYRNVVVAKDNTILAGHGVVKAAKELNMTTIPVVRLKISPEDTQALKLLAADNYIQHLSFDDDRMLTELLKEVSSEEGLLGTGFDDASLAAYAMVSRPADEIGDFDAAMEWAEAGMPEFEDPTTMDEFSKEAFVNIKFPTAEHREQWVEKATQADPELVETVRRLNNWSLRWPASESIDQREDLSSVEFTVDINE